MSKYYLAHNAAGRLIGGEQFEVTEIFAGTSIGVFEGKTDAQIAELDKAVEAKTGVSVISETEYKAAIQKKIPNLTSFPNSNYKMPQVSLASRAGVVVEEPVSPDLSEEKKLETVDGALGSLGKVEAPPKADEAAAPESAPIEANPKEEPPAE